MRQPNVQPSNDTRLAPRRGASVKEALRCGARGPAAQISFHGAVYWGLTEPLPPPPDSWLGARPPRELVNPGSCPGRRITIGRVDPLGWPLGGRWAWTVPPWEHPLFPDGPGGHGRPGQKPQQRVNPDCPQHSGHRVRYEVDDPLVIGKVDPAEGIR